MDFTKHIVFTAAFMILLLFFVNSGYSLDMEFPVKFEKNDGFTICLPEEWEEVPKQQLEAFSAAMAAQIKDASMIQTFEYGFQRGSTTNGLHYPYILVQIKNTGRISESQLRSLPELEKSMEDAANTMSEDIHIIDSVLSLIHI